MLNSKRQKEGVLELVKHVSQHDQSHILIPLVFRLANNYKLADLPEFQSFITEMVNKSMKSNQFNIKLLEGLISIGQRE